MCEWSFAQSIAAGRSGRTRDAAGPAVHQIVLRVGAAELAAQACAGRLHGGAAGDAAPAVANDSIAALDPARAAVVDVRGRVHAAAAAGEALRAHTGGRAADATEADEACRADQSARAAIAKVSPEVDAAVTARGQLRACAGEALAEATARSRRAGVAARATVLPVAVEIDAPAAAVNERRRAREVGRRNEGRREIGDGEIDRHARVGWRRDRECVAIARGERDEHEGDPRRQAIPVGATDVRLCSCANGHLHTPLLHEAPAGHAMRQPPQFIGSLWTLTHVPQPHASGQLISPDWQETLQAPPEQTCPGQHTTPHPPQFR